jgi:hypothetical protein
MGDRASRAILVTRKIDIIYSFYLLERCVVLALIHDMLQHQLKDACNLRSRSITPSRSRLFQKHCSTSYSARRAIISLCLPLVIEQYMDVRHKQHRSLST